MPRPAETSTAEPHPSTRKARRMAGARRRAQASRDRRAAEVESLRAAAAEVESLRATAAEAEDLRARLTVDGALVDALVTRYRQLREETGQRAPALPLGDVVRLARHALGPGVPEVEAAIRDRLGAALNQPAAPAA
ncbi:hypothetical protein [Methylobacterium sp. ID0610]|uniref:hypothetical protein n=1 Tax=Methylobacterium carpenticola TaxID=3344827 RepID=UPI0036799014